MDEEMINLQDPNATYYIFSYTNEYLFVVKKQLGKTGCPLLIVNSQIKSDQKDPSVYI
jgi:hypothetical protein